jgi:hypothetical protein
MSKLLQVVLWIAVIGSYFFTVITTLQYDKMIDDCIARDKFELRGDEYMCVMIERERL